MQSCSGNESDTDFQIARHWRMLPSYGTLGVKVHSGRARYFMTVEALPALPAIGADGLTVV